MCTFNRGTECDSVYESCGVKVYLTKQCGGSVIHTVRTYYGAGFHTHGIVVLRSTNVLGGGGLGWG